MSEMSSFYGGRQGAPFIVVKRFDGVDIPQVDGSYVYTIDAYAIDNNEEFIIVSSELEGGNVLVADNAYLIKKTPANRDFYTFAYHNNDGTLINNTLYNFPSHLAEGMVQCFAKGAQSASEVNYGEYVLIDTITGLNDHNSPDHGKVFRRGMNIDTELAGAEYIGCIVGPKGEIIDFELGHYEDIYPNRKGAGEYNVSPDEDLVPGYSINASTGSPVYEDTIKYAYVTLKDEYNNITGTRMGFKIPTLVEDFEATSVSPYINRHSDGQGGYYNDHLIDKDSSQFVDGSWLHPFYQKWQIKVPHGYHGTNVEDIQIVPTKTMPRGFKSDDFLGTAVYEDQTLTTQITTLSTSANIVLSSYDPANDWAEIDFGGSPAYVSQDECYEEILRYKEVNFDEHEAGDFIWRNAGYINDIQRIAISDNGIIAVYYRGDIQTEILEEKVRWIDNENAPGIVLNNDGTIIVYYNTTHASVDPSLDPYQYIDIQDRAHDHQDFVKAFRWVTRIDITDNGDIVIYDNQGGEYLRKEKFSKVIRRVDVQLLDPNNPNAIEGSGDQKMRITYNTTSTQGGQTVPDVDTIGNPINYIIETAMTKRTEETPNAPDNHLLVYYADPALRASLQSKWITWYSEKLEQNLTEWVDLGPCRGAAGGIHILKEVLDMRILLDENGDWIPPEQLEDMNDHVINPESAGWSCLFQTYSEYIQTTSSDPDALEIVANGATAIDSNQISLSIVEAVNPGDFQVGDYVKHGDIERSEFLYYDYEKSEWSKGAASDLSNIDPKHVIVVSSSEPSDLNTDGLWMIQTSMISAY